jgi:hypothetical protein
VLPLTKPHESSGVLSLLFVVAYLGMGVPSVIAGTLVVHGGGLVPTSEEYGAVVIALALLALAALLLRGGPQTAPGVLVASGGSPAVEAREAERADVASR